MVRQISPPQKIYRDYVTGSNSRMLSSDISRSSEGEAMSMPFMAAMPTEEKLEAELCPFALTGDLFSKMW